MGAMPSERGLLAAATAAALRDLNPLHRQAHEALASALRAVGIRSGMHTERLRTGPQPLLTSSASVAEARQRVEDALASIFSAELVVHDWPRDERIEYKLGQLLTFLDRGGPASWSTPSEHAESLGNFRVNLLELRQVFFPVQVVGLGEVSLGSLLDHVEGERAGRHAEMFMQSRPGTGHARTLRLGPEGARKGGGPRGDAERWCAVVGALPVSAER
ncbi:hypothetical protein ABZ930_30940 [Streptomyces sp. NPDC046716]|uniref:hypothetical protein n=1 Tax=Streptomyces sp. NPDC046716 TaxID=3157093 RepID=UPI0033C0BA56